MRKRLCTFCHFKILWARQGRGIEPLLKSVCTSPLEAFSTEAVRNHIDYANDIIRRLNCRPGTLNTMEPLSMALEAH